jgi:hypothetical protein
MMMVPMLKLHPSSVEVLMVFVVNGATWMLISLLFLLYFFSDLWVHDVRLIQMINDVINALYSDICSYTFVQTWS